MNISVVFWCLLLIVFIYLVFQQLKNAENEDFEKRDN